MREHHLSVMSLEEYEPNREFVGRNFNAGEIIQLVLKSRSSGRWLPFGLVQLVMMHELAHCKQMNHSKAFWAVRNQFAEQMRALWSSGYIGEGIWGRGTHLSTGEWEANTVMPDEALPEHLCGGTYRSRRRKRRAKAVLSYQEQKERRILKKFGANGTALGESELGNYHLEGKLVASKPRVAGSKRGRELRAAAALARFDQQKKEAAVDEMLIKEEDETASEPETDSDYDDDALPGTTGADAVDIDGQILLDGKGQGMVKVCEDENPNDGDAKNERSELQSSIRNSKPASTAATTEGRNPNLQPTKKVIAAVVKVEEKASNVGGIGPRSETKTTLQTSRNQATSEPSVAPCPICSFANAKDAITCGVCSHVLDAESVPGSWHCQSSTCRATQYMNSGDCGVCGVCGGSRSTASG
jgi:DNA-dependent metalloprotease WSS1